MEELELNQLTSKVLDCVDLIPRGSVASYGDIASIVGTGPRQIGRIMSTHGHLSNWWRVVRSDGGSHVADRARELWNKEGITYTHGAELKVRMAVHRIDEATEELMKRSSLA